MRLTPAEIRRLLARDLDTLAYAGRDDLAIPADKRAAVLIPIVDYADAQHVLFTRRTAHLRHHSGQVAFPGGRVEAQVFEVPFRFLMDPGNHAQETRNTDRGIRIVNVIQYGPHRIWGATASIVLELCRRLTG